MECPSCGAHIRDSAVFCSSCGQRITSQTLQTRIPPRQAAEPPVEPLMSPGPPPHRPPAQPTGERSGANPSQPTERASAAARNAPGAAPDFARVFASAARLLRLDTTVFRELAGDQRALIPSLALVAVALLLMSLGGWLWWLLEIDFGSGRFFARSVVGGTIFAYLLWLGWVWVAGFILERGFRRRASFLALIPPLGLAAIPFALGLLMLIDPLMRAFGIGAIAATVALTQVALQEATDATPGEALAANLAGFLLWAVILSFLGGGTRNLGPGMFM